MQCIGGIDGAGAPHAGIAGRADESFYADAYGLAECLEGEIIRVSRPEAQTDRVPQFGPEPLISMEASPYAGRRIELAPPIGAIGYTFDTDTDAPLFVRTSFLQDPPAVDGAVADLAWHFLKVRYRRRLDALGVAPALETKPLASEWSDPVWVQLLPAADRITDKSDRTVDVADLSFDPKTGKIHDATLAEFRPAPTAATGTCTFALYALITLAISDAFGRSDQETFVKMVPIETLPAVTDLLSE